MSINAWLIMLLLAAVSIAGVIVFLAQFRTRRVTAILALVIAMFAALVLCAFTFLGGSFQLKPLAHHTLWGGFPFPVGTTWVYSRVQYEQVVGDPTQLITATNLITETVVRIQGSDASQEFLHKQTASLVSASPGWEDNSSNFNWESWYRIEGNRVISSPEGHRQISTLVSEFPFAVGKSWCPMDPLPDNLPSCHMNGLRFVQNRVSYTTPLGAFDQCYEIIEEINSGGVREWFCDGIGTVARKYDHSGTRFGYEDALIRFSMGPTDH